MTRRTYGFSFSPSRAIGLAGAKGRLSREIGVPLTQGGRERKLGRLVGQSLGWLLLVALLGLASLFGIGR